MTLSPNNFEAHVALGWMYNDHGRLADAEKEFELAIKMDAKCDGGHEGMGFYPHAPKAPG